jgi:transcription initiation factor IIE alpha subunit
MESLTEKQEKVFNAVGSLQYAFRSEISIETGITKREVSNILRQLKRKNLIICASWMGDWTQIRK